MADEERDNLNLDETSNEENSENEVSDQEIEELEEGIVPGLSERELVHEVKQSFLDYAMSVIVSRAIPDVRDGLKPVHRRIIFGMNEQGMQPDKPYKKCARIVGDVMGKYHPHGDAAIYSALVRLAQPFSIRYTLVDGHGNFGSVDGDEAAAMRYTEARMSKICLEMVRDIKKDTVDFIPNYDGEEEEPTVLPSRIPNLLINGSNGIAVGMATNIPPHNLTEVINALIAISENENLTPLEIMTNYLYGPDFPTGGIILGRSGIRKAYETGQGSITIRSRAEIEEMANGKKRIIVTEIPYQVNKSAMLEAIGHLVHNKVIEGITDIRDESNKEGIRVVIELRKDVVPEVVLNQLFKNSQLQTSFGIIMLCLVGGEPKILPINKILKHYLDFQCEVIERRTRYDLKKALDQLHILEGLLIAIDNIDEVVSIIRNARTTDEAKSKLMERFSLSEAQTKAILDMRLARLVGLEKDNIESNIQALHTEIDRLQYILSSHEHILATVIDELKEIKEKYGDERKTEISNENSDIDDEDLIPKEDIVISLTESGYIKRMNVDTFKVQNRGGVGVSGGKMNKEDVTSIITYSKTHTDLLFFTSVGKVYRLRGYKVPEFSRTSKGIPVQNLLALEDNEKVLAIINVDDYNENAYLFFATRKGVVKKTSLMEFESIRQNGKIAISMREGDELIGVKLTDGHALISLASDNNKMVTFHEEDVREMGRMAAGVKGMDIGENDNVISITTSLEGKYILALSEKGYGKMSPLEDYRLTSRGSKGVLTMNISERNGKLVATRAVNGDEDIIIITKLGVVIRTSLSQVAISGRNTLGVKIIRLRDDESVSSLTTVEHEDEEVLDEANQANQETTQKEE